MVFSTIPSASRVVPTLCSPRGGGDPDGASTLGPPPEAGQCVCQKTPLLHAANASFFYAQKRVVPKVFDAFRAFLHYTHTTPQLGRSGHRKPH